MARRGKAEGTRTLRKDRRGRDPFVVGALVILAAAIGTYFGFSKHIPFTHGYRVNAVFDSAVSIRKNSPVRIAGVNVGKVVGVRRAPGTSASIVELELQKRALPLHTDATMKIRPRIFLEGNFFVDVQPGSPSAPELKEDGTLPVTQTSVPVQFDQVLTTFQGDTRTALKTVIGEFGRALSTEPTPAQDADQDPLVRGDTAAQALNKAIVNGGDALRDASIVNTALLGTQPHDLSQLVAGLGRVTAALDSDEGQLKGLVSSFNTTMGAFASESQNLGTSVRLLGPTLDSANRAFASLNGAFPSIRAFSKEILPGVRETPATIAAAFPWIAQTRRLLSAKELRGLTNELRPTTANLSRVVDVSLSLLPQADLVAQCATNVVLPTGDIKIDEGGLSANTENYKEFWYTMVGLAGESQNFDANGLYVRFQPGGGDQTISTGKVGGALGDQLYGNVSTKPLGTRPAYPGRRPPYRDDVPCKDQKVPDLNGAKTGPADGGGRGVRVVADDALRAGGTGRRSAATSASSTSAAGAAAGSASDGAPPARRTGDTLTDRLVGALNPFRTGGQTP